ncbi:MAG: type II toxin-antitoxin system HicB family antitoxin [Clostridiales Family XIII bacterium]|jgi:predicted RNase H-like HicB family nuclease|nr:type II toxin-antitoxin system HicB family antitoxin [Clostridiales Family XIII bacterium]
MKLIYPAIFYPDGDAYAVVVPDLPGCATGGNTLAEALDMAIDAASGWILSEWENGNHVPAPSPVKKIEADSPDAFVSVIALDMTAYAERFGKKAVRKNLTIPAWLNTFAETNHINFSRVLQDALTEIAISRRAGM